MFTSISVLAVAAFANLSASSFPLMPMWLGSHTVYLLTICNNNTCNLLQQVRSTDTFNRHYSEKLSHKYCYIIIKSGMVFNV